MSKTLLRNTSSAAITLPPPYTGIIAPGDAVVIDEAPSVVAEKIGIIPELISFLTVTQVPDAQPGDGHTRASAAEGIADALANLEIPLDLNGQRIINVADPIAAQDAATQQYVIDYVATHGGGGGGSGVTEVSSANAYLTVANGTSTPVLTVEVGTVANKVAAGDDARFVDSAPSTAGGVVYDSGAAYTKTAAGSAGQVLKVGVGGLPEWGDESTAPSGAAGGSLAGSYPNPTIASGAISNTEIAVGAAIDTTKLSGLLTDIAGNGLEAFVDAATKVARTYYVSVDGSDLNDGSISKPFATIQAAHDEAAAEYTGDEFVSIEVGPGQFSGDVNVTRKNTLIQGAGHRAEMFVTKIVGSITVNAAGATQKNTDLVGLAGCFVAPSSGSTAPAVKVTGSTVFSFIANDCYLYTTNAAATANGLACDNTNATRVRIIANDCIIATESDGPAIVQLDRGDARFNNTQVRHNNGVTLGAAGNGVNVLNDATLWLNSSLVETRTRGAAISATGASAGIKLLMTIGSVTTAYAGAEDTTHGITVSNTAGAAAFLWQTSFSVADVSAAVYAINGSAPAVVVYGELSFVPGTNSKIAPSVTLSAMTETHGTLVLPSLTASLPLKLDANKTMTAAAISLTGSEVTGTLPVGKGGTGISTTPPAGTVAYGNGTTQAYTVVGTAGQALLSDGTNAPAFGALSLSGAAVTGTLPKGNQEAQDVAGDLSGTTDAAVVTALQGNPVAAGALGAGDAGKALVWSGSEYAPATITPGGGGGGGSGGLVYYFNYNTAGEAPVPVGAKQLALTYDETAQNTGAVEAPNGSYATLAEFVTDLNLPGATTIPPGTWDIATYLNLATGANNTFFRVRVFKWDGTTLTELATSPSDDVALTSTTLPTQYTASVYIEQAVLTATDRIVVRLEIKRTTAASRLVTGYFGGDTPSHVHTSIGAPGGTGLVKVVDGIIQAPAELLFNADVDAAAAIEVSKLESGAASTVLHGGSPNYFGKVQLGTEVDGTLPVGNGGTGLTAGTSGGVPYFNSTSTMASSAALTQNALVLGGGAGGAPASLGSLGTTSTVLHGNAAGAPTFGAVALASDVSGTLPVANGGTNATSVGAAGTVAYSTGSAYDFTAAGTAGDILTSGGLGAPVWVSIVPYTHGGTGGTAVPTANQVPYGTGTALAYTAGGSIGEVLGIGAGGQPEWISNGSSPTGAAGGDLSSNYPNPTVAKINGTTITTAGGALLTGTVLRATGAATADWGALDLGGANSVTGALAKVHVPAETVYTDGTYADPAWITSLAGSKVDGDITGNAANVTGTVAVANGGTGLTTVGTAGTIAYSNGTTLAFASVTQHAVLLGGGTSAPGMVSGLGTAGQVLTSNGPGVDPTWQATAGGTVTDVTSANAYITVADGNSTPELTLNVGTSINTVAAGTDTRFNVAPSAGNGRLAYTAAGAWSTLAPGAAGTFLKSDGTALSFASIDLSTDVSGTLAIARGGTGITSAGGTANRALYTTDGTAFTVGQLPNAALANASITVTAGAGLTGGGTVELGDSITLTANRVPYDIAAEAVGKPASSAVVMRYTATRAFDLSALASDHVFKAQIGATNNSDFVVTRTRSGTTVTILTATFGAGGASPQIATISTPANTSIQAGDDITVTAPLSQDTTLKDINWTMSGLLP